MIRKVAAVTGSRRGIGRGIAEALAAQGYAVVLSGVSRAEDAVELVAQLRDKGAEAIYVPCNIGADVERGRFFGQIGERYHRLDVLVNNAGIAPPERADILETTEENFDAVLDINLKGTFFMCQMAANAMIAMQERGLPDYHPRIVNIGSISAYTASLNRGEYCVSKAGIAMVTQLFALRLAAYGIPVFEVRPGIVETDMTAPVHDTYARLIAEGLTPLRRFGKPQDVADCVVAAVSGRLDFATGQVLNADGGFHLRRL